MNDGRAVGIPCRKATGNPNPSKATESQKAQERFLTDPYVMGIAAAVARIAATINAKPRAAWPLFKYLAAKGSSVTYPAMTPTSR